MLNIGEEKPSVAAFFLLCSGSALRILLSDQRQASVIIMSAFSPKAFLLIRLSSETHAFACTRFAPVIGKGLRHILSF